MAKASWRWKEKKPSQSPAFQAKRNSIRCPPCQTQSFHPLINWFALWLALGWVTLSFWETNRLLSTETALAARALPLVRRMLRHRRLQCRWGREVGLLQVWTPDHGQQRISQCVAFQNLLHGLFSQLLFISQHNWPLWSHLLLRGVTRRRRDLNSKHLISKDVLCELVEGVQS